MTQDQGRKRRRLIGIGFITAFILSTLTIIYTGLNVRAPGSHRTQETSSEQAMPAEDPEAAELADDETAAPALTRP
jgi:hypothetical protein